MKCKLLFFSVFLWLCGGVGFVCAQTPEAAVNRQRGGEGDGYGSSMAFHSRLLGGGVVCEGESVMLTLQLSGVEGEYRIRWFREGSADELQSGSYMLQGTADSIAFMQVVYRFPATMGSVGNYYCQIGSGKGDWVHSDTVSLQVREAVRTSVLSPALRDTLVCPGAEVALRGWVSDTTVETYWQLVGGDPEGEELAYGDENEVWVEQECRYVYIAEGVDCVIGDTVHIRVKDIRITLPEQVRVVEGQTAVVRAFNAQGYMAGASGVSWWFNGSEMAASTNPLRYDAVESGELKVVYDTAGCRLEATSNLRVREDRFSNGGSGDGYAVNAGVKTQCMLERGQICEEDSVRLTAYVYNSTPERLSVVFYQVWPAREEIEVQETGREHYTCASESGPAGRKGYLCEVKNAHSDVVAVSDTVWVNVTALPRVTVPQDTLLCPGDDFLLEGYCSEAGAVQEWYAAGGSSPLRGADLRVSPRETATYVFRADNDGCVMTDSVKVIRDARLKVVLPDVLHLAPGTVVNLSARDGNGGVIAADSLRWYLNGTLLPDAGNPYSYTAVQPGGVLKVIFAPLHCALEDSTVIRVREVNVTAGGIFGGGCGDGFARTTALRVRAEVSAEDLVEGETVCFQATVEGIAGSARFRWYREDSEGNAVECMTDSAQACIRGVQVADAGVYYCELTDQVSGMVVRSNAVNLRVKNVYTTGRSVDDGYAVNCVAPLVTDGSVLPPAVCQGDTAAMLSVYVSATDPVCRWEHYNAVSGRYEELEESAGRYSGFASSLLKISPVMGEDAGSYRCRVVNRCVAARLEGEEIRLETVYSDTVYSRVLTLEVKERPVATIVSPATDTLRLCAGEEYVLSAVSSVAEAENFWVGYRYDGVDLRVKPEVFTAYVFESEYQGCVGRDTVWVQPDTSSVYLTRHHFATTEGRPVELSVANTASLTVDSLFWYRSDTCFARGTSSVVMSDLDRSQMIYVVYHTPAGCRVSDSARVLVRPLHIFGGGAQDGYVQNSTHFEVRVTSPGEVCEGGSFNLTATVVQGREDVNYVYQWYRYVWLDDHDSLVECPTRRANLVVENASVADNGLYFCEVTDGLGGAPVRSDEVTMTVIPAVTVGVELPVGGQDTLCLGDTIQLKGVLNGLTGHNRIRVRWTWEGREDAGGILGDAALTEVWACPQESGKYLFRIENKGCMSETEVNVVVNAPDLDLQVPELIVAAQGDEVEIPATDKRGHLLWRTRLQWTSGGTSLSEMAVNPLYLTADSSMVVRCTYTNLGCSNSAYTRLRVRPSAVYAGGIEDGYGKSCRPYELHLPLVDSLDSGDTLYVEVPYRGLHYFWNVALKDGTVETYGPMSGGLVLPGITSVYDSSYVWCALSDECMQMSDSMLLHVKAHIRLSVPSDTLRFCPGDSVAVVVRLAEGEMPWNYRYVLADGTSGVRTGLQGETDSLYVGQAGSYGFAGLLDGVDGDTLRTVEVAAYPGGSVRLAVDAGRDTVCMNDSVYLRVSVSGGSGWWQLTVGDEVQETELRLAGSSDTLFYAGIAYESTTYRIYEWRDEGTGCRFRAEDTVNVVCGEGAFVGFRLLGDAHVGMCRDADLYREWQPLLYRPGMPAQVAGPEEGVWVADSVELDSAGIWPVAGVQPGWHELTYRLYEDVGCVAADVIRLYVDSLPSLEVESAGYWCEGGTAEVRIRTKGGEGSRIWSRTTAVMRSGSVNSYSREVVAAGNVDELVIKNPLCDSCLLIRVDSMMDVHGCKAYFSDVYRLDVHLLPHVAVEGRYEADGEWTRAGLFELAAGEELEVKVELESGSAPWHLIRNADTVNGIVTREYQFGIREGGVYRFRAGDEYCRGKATDSIEVILRDTAYVSLQVLLEEGYDPAGDTMRAEMPLVVEIREAANAAFAAAGKDSCRLLARKTCRLLRDGTVVDDGGNRQICFPGVLKSEGGDSCYLVVGDTFHLPVMTCRPLRWSEDGTPLAVVDLRDGAQVYTTDSLTFHMTRFSNGRWVVPAGEKNGNALITVKDEIAFPLEFEGPEVMEADSRRAYARRNRHKFTEIGRCGNGN